jgi:hypothetical protein
MIDSDTTARRRHLDKILDECGLDDEPREFPDPATCRRWLLVEENVAEVAGGPFDTRQEAIDFALERGETTP